MSCQPKLQPKNSCNPLSDWRTKKMTSFILLLAQSTNIYTNYFVNYVSKILRYTRNNSNAIPKLPNLYDDIMQ